MTEPKPDYTVKIDPNPVHTLRQEHGKQTDKDAVDFDRLMKAAGWEQKMGAFGFFLQMWQHRNGRTVQHDPAFAHYKLRLELPAHVAGGRVGRLVGGV